jgi:hypothetical protein
VIPDVCAPATLDAFRKLLAGTLPFEPSTMQESLNPKCKMISKSGMSKKNTYEVLLGTMFASEPHPLIDSGPQVRVVLLEEVRRQVGVASAGERVVFFSVAVE